MDEQKENNDAVSENNDSPDTGVNIAVKTESSVEPAVNDTQAPPEPEVTIKEDDAAAVDSAVNDIAGSSEVVPDSANPSEEPSMKEAPDSSVDEAEENSEKIAQVKTDPFAEKVDESAPPAFPTATQHMSNNEQSMTHEHRNNKKFAIIITVTVALLMALASVYVYLNAQKNTEESSLESSTADNTQTAEITPANASDVEQASNEVDQTVQSIDDTADFNEDDISDTTLGL